MCIYTTYMWYVLWSLNLCTCVLPPVECQTSLQCCLVCRQHVSKQKNWHPVQRDAELYRKFLRRHLTPSLIPAESFWIPQTCPERHTTDQDVIALCSYVSCFYKPDNKSWVEMTRNWFLEAKCWEQSGAGCGIEEEDLKWMTILCREYTIKRCDVAFFSNQLETLAGSEGSRRLRLSDFKVAGLSAPTYRLPLPSRIYPRYSTESTPAP